MIQHHSLPHFLFYSSPIDVLSLLHSFAFTLHIPHSSPPRSARPWVFPAKNAHPAWEVEYPLSCRRPIISPRTFPSTSTALTCYAYTYMQRSPVLTRPVLTFRVFHRLVLYILHVLLYHHHSAIRIPEQQYGAEGHLVT